MKEERRCCKCGCNLARTTEGPCCKRCAARAEYVADRPIWDISCMVRSERGIIAWTPITGAMRPSKLTKSG